MAVKEHFSMELLESQKRRECVTVRFDESASWKNLSLNGTFGLMRGFMAGRLPAADVFDVELMARFIAVAEVWRTHHTLAWHIMRFYFNPLTAHLEPIGFDGNL